MASTTQTPKSKEPGQIGENIYTVERIIRQRRRNGQTEYLVKWLHWDDEEYNTWEPEVNIIDKGIIAAFERSVAKKIWHTEKGFDDDAKSEDEEVAKVTDDGDDGKEKSKSKSSLKRKASTDEEKSHKKHKHNKHKKDKEGKDKKKPAATSKEPAATVAKDIEKRHASKKAKEQIIMLCDDDDDQVDMQPSISTKTARPLGHQTHLPFSQVTFTDKPTHMPIMVNDRLIDVVEYHPV